MNYQKSCGAPRRAAAAASWLSAAALIALVALPAAAEPNWASFQNGGSPRVEAADPPAGELARAWSAEIPGYGQSSPVFWKGRIYVTSVSGANKEQYHITAYEADSGERLWQHDLENASPEESNNYISKAAPTPAADAEGVICFFEGGNLVALTHDGQVRWERNLVEESGPIDARHGLAGSVEQNEELAFLWVERQTEPYVLAVDKLTGQTRWQVAGIGVTSWASPRLVPVVGGEHLVLSGIGILAGLDPSDGQRLWTFEEISGNSTPTPVPVGEGRFLIGATEGRGEGEGGRAAESNGLVEIRRGEDNRWQAQFAWRADRATSSFGSPVGDGQHAYFVNRAGVLYCLDAASGEERYARRLAGSIWATPVVGAEQLYFFGKDGAVQVVSRGDRFEVLHQTDVFAPAAGEAGGSLPGATLYAAIASPSGWILRSGSRLELFKNGGRSENGKLGKPASAGTAS